MSEELTRYMTKQDLLDFWEFLKTTPEFVIIFLVILAIIIFIVVIFAKAYIKAENESEEIRQRNIEYIRNLNERIKKLEEDNK